jgi:hypothetical protein
VILDDEIQLFQDDDVKKERKKNWRMKIMKIKTFIFLFLICKKMVKMKMND